MTFVGVVLAVVGLVTPSPTIVGAGAVFDRPGVVRGVLAFGVVVFALLVTHRWLSGVSLIATLR